MRTSKIYISISDAKKNLNKLISEGTTTVLTKNDKPFGVIISYEDYISMLRAYREVKDKEAIKIADDHFKKINDS